MNFILYLINYSVFFNRGDSFVSSEKHKSGTPFITFKKSGSEVTVNTLQGLIQLLSSAGDCKMDEARFCLEGKLLSITLMYDI